MAIKPGILYSYVGQLIAAYGSVISCMLVLLRDLLEDFCLKICLAVSYSLNFLINEIFF
jgi:hypothetical protein